LCVVHGKKMVRLAYPIEEWENNFTTKNIDFIAM
jgi:hypothetical protein